MFANKKCEDSIDEINDYEAKAMAESEEVFRTSQNKKVAALKPFDR